MKRIDALVKIFEVEFEFKNLLDPIFDDGLQDIYGIFDFKFEGVVHVLLDYKVFEDDLSYNVDDMFIEEERLNNFVRICLQKQPNLNEEMSKEDTVNTIIELIKIERMRWETYTFWSGKGVSFDIFEGNLLGELIDELLNFKLGDVFFDFAAVGLDEGELKEYLMDHLQSENEV